MPGRGRDGTTSDLVSPGSNHDFPDWVRQVMWGGEFGCIPRPYRSGMSMIINGRRLVIGGSWSLDNTQLDTVMATVYKILHHMEQGNPDLVFIIPVLRMTSGGTPMVYVYRWYARRDGRIPMDRKEGWSPSSDYRPAGQGGA